jgi:WhiB family redox-sensing transcriptional regulator
MSRPRSINLPTVAPAATAAELAWERDAACRDHDPDLFFPEWGGNGGVAQRNRAIAICARCPIHAVIGCARKALSTHTDYGVWAGEHFGTTAKTREIARANLAAIAGIPEAN